MKAYSLLFVQWLWKNAFRMANSSLAGIFSWYADSICSMEMIHQKHVWLQDNRHSARKHPHNESLAREKLHYK
jgi:hypothetical protein